MLCDIDVQDTPTVVTDDEKAIERAEGDRRNSEEVHRGNRFTVITEKGKPSQNSGGRTAMSLISKSARVLANHRVLSHFPRTIAKVTGKHISHRRLFSFQSTLAHHLRSRINSMGRIHGPTSGNQA